MADEETKTETAAEGKSIIDAKYRDRGTVQDWVTQFIDSHVKKPVMKTVHLKDDEGKETGETEEVATKRTQLDVEALFDLAAANHLNVENLRQHIGTKNGAGRLRMSIGNSLRAAAKKRHGLKNLEGEFMDADEEFCAQHEKIETPDGQNIAKMNAAAAKDAETEETEAAE
jgi:hypothetical protein